MELPVLNGVIDRRILVNYRVAPEVVKALLPAHLEPLIVNGYASAGICLLRLKHIGIKYSPSFLRITSENAAHRFLVTYKEQEQEKHGVYIPRRDTDSMLNVWLAGKIFSWPHFPANFEVRESGVVYSVKMHGEDSNSSLRVEAEVSSAFPTDSMFDSINHASGCFEKCNVGISPSTKPGQFMAIELKTKSWLMKPLKALSLESSFYEDTSIFPKGSIHFDNALLMENIEHEWKTLP